MKHIALASFVSVLLSSCLITPTEPAQPSQSAIGTNPGTGADGDSIVCSGAEDIRIENRQLEFAQDGIVVMGACDIVIVNSTISAGRHALVVTGSGDIVLENSTVVGGAAAAIITGSGDVTARGSSMVGGIQVTGSGDFNDEGGNSLQ